MQLLELLILCFELLQSELVLVELGVVATVFCDPLEECWVHVVIEIVLVSMLFFHVMVVQVVLCHICGVDVHRVDICKRL